MDYDVKLYPVVATNVIDGRAYELKDEVELEDWLGEQLQSESTRNLIAALLAQAEAGS